MSKVLTLCFMLLFFISTKNDCGAQTSVLHEGPIYLNKSAEITDKCSFFAAKGPSSLVNPSNDYRSDYVLPWQYLNTCLAQGVLHHRLNNQGHPLIIQSVNSYWAKGFILILLDIYKKKINIDSIVDSEGRSIEAFIQENNPKTNYQALFYEKIRAALKAYKDTLVEKITRSQLAKNLLSLFVEFITGESEIESAALVRMNYLSGARNTQRPDDVPYQAPLSDSNYYVKKLLCSPSQFRDLLFSSVAKFVSRPPSENYSTEYWLQMPPQKEVSFTDDFLLATQQNEGSCTGEAQRREAVSSSELVFDFN